MGALRSFEGRRVVISGASSGIGRLLALRAAEEGAHVALLARRRGKLEAVAAEAREHGVEAHAIECDVADRESALEGARHAEERLGRVDVLVNNAGYGLHKKLLEHDLASAESLLTTNLFGALRLTRALAPAMVERGEGWIVFMASIAGLIPVPGEAVYCASKFGMVGLAESFSIEVAQRGVHVLTVCPGAVNTGFVRPGEQDRVSEAAKRTLIEPEEVVEATFKALARGADRVVVPRSLALAVATRGVLPSLVKRGTERALRAVLDESGIEEKGPEDE